MCGYVLYKSTLPLVTGFHSKHWSQENTHLWPQTSSLKDDGVELDDLQPSFYPRNSWYF